MDKLNVTTALDVFKLFNGEVNNQCNFEQVFNTRLMFKGMCVYCKKKKKKHLRTNVISICQFMVDLKNALCACKVIDD